MAKQCCACGKKLSFMEPGNQIDSRYPDFELCLSCLNQFRDLESTKDYVLFERAYKHFEQFLVSPDTPQGIKDKIEKRRNETEKRVAVQKAYDDRLDNMLVTTCDVLSGCEVKHYFGMVSMDVLYHNGLKDMAGSVANNFGTGTFLSGSELKVVTDLVENAKKNVLDKMKCKAADMGANAILGMTVDVNFYMPSTDQNVVRTSTMAEFVKVSMSGTAALVDLG